MGEVQSSGRRAIGRVTQSYWFRVSVWSIVYFLTARLSLYGPSVGFLSLPWLPGGVSLGLVLLYGPRYLPAIIAGSILSSYRLPNPFLVVPALALAQVADALVGWYLLRRVCKIDVSIRRVSDVTWFLVAGAGMATVPSVIVITFFVRPLLGDGLDITAGSYGLVVWAGNVIGVTSVAPVILIWAGKRWRKLLGRMTLEAGALTLLLSALCLAAYLYPEIIRAKYLIQYSVFPIVMWVATRYGTQGASLINLGVSLIALLFAPFLMDVSGDSALKSFLWLPSLILATVITSLVVGAITEERRTAIADLSRSEQKFVRIFMASPEAVTITRLRDGMYLDVNEAFTRGTGYKREDVLGRTALELNIWASDFNRNSFIDQIRARGSVSDMEFKYRIRSGEVREGTISSVPIAIDDEVCVLSVARDVTEQRRAEHALRESEKWFRLSFEHAPIGLVFNSVDTNEFKYNRAFREMLGYAADEMARHDISVFTHPDDLERTQVEVRRLLDGQVEIVELDKRYLRKDGGSVDAHTSISVVKDAGGVPRFRIAQVLDLSVRRGLDEDFRRGQTMEMVGRLAGGIAHDFNNLMMVIQGHNELALSRMTADDPLRKNAEEIQQAAERAANLTRQLLAYSRRQVLRPAPVNLPRLLDDVSKMLRQVINSRIVISAETAPDLSPVFADEFQLRQVIISLALNAEDAMPEGGALRFRARNLDLAESVEGSHGVVPPGQYVELRAQDTGVGMDAEMMAHIFEPFFAGPGEMPSAGLGLASVHGIIKQSGGHISVLSSPSAGSTFTLYLPVKTRVAG